MSTPEDDLLREIEWLDQFAQADLDESAADGGVTVAMVYQQEARTVLIPRLRALATRLSAAHQPAGAKGENYPTTAEMDEWYAWAREWSASAFLAGETSDTDAGLKTQLYSDLCRLGNHFWAWKDGLALPPPAPTLDPEAVARVIWDTTRWSPEMPSFAHEYPWDREWPAGHEGLRELILQQAAAVIAMAPPADASQSAEVERVGLETREEFERFRASVLYATDAEIDQALSPTPPVDGQPQHWISVGLRVRHHERTPMDGDASVCGRRGAPPALEAQATPMNPHPDIPAHRPLAGVHDETIYHVLSGERGSQSWFDKCNALEAALVKAGWTPPSGHPLALSGEK